MKTATIIQAKVKYPVDRVRKTKYGDKIKLVAARADGGADVELWDIPGSALHYLPKGEPIQILFDGQRYTLLALPTDNQATNGNGHPDNPHPTHPPTPGAIALSTPASIPPKSADVKEWITIFEELRAALPQAQESTWRAAASTLFMQRCKAQKDFDEVF